MLYAKTRCRRPCSLRHAMGMAGMLLCLSGPGLAQSLAPRCPEPPPAPEFVTRTMTELANLQPHTERWGKTLHWQRLLRELDRLRLDGLNPSHYQLSDIARIAQQWPANGAPRHCQAELASLALAWSLNDLAFGRLDPEPLDLMWHQNPRLRDPGQFAIDIHRAFHEQQGLGKAYRAVRPGVAPYQTLRAAYREIRRNQPERWPIVAEGPTLRAGDNNSRVRELARRLAAQQYLPRDHADPASTDAPDMSPPPQLFDEAITNALIAFQQDHGLEDDGLAGRDTLAALNLPPEAWTARMRANLERLRWISPYLRSNMVLVDIAGARIHLLRDGAEIWRGNTQVGRPERKTPALTSSISHITMNPTWTIPPTIFQEDTLPAIQSDPDYLNRNRLTVLDQSGTPLAPDQVDWARPGNLRLRQAAGPGNALGKVAMRFPNPFSVYLHDTPSRRLFTTPERFYSSGCVRVENAVALTDHLFRDAPAQVLQGIDDARESGDTRTIFLPGGITLIMAYWTADTDSDGKIRFRPDPYEEDALIVDLLEQQP